ncbi:hypothetical protein [Tautonia sociabilis]|uniref:Uncharacterized protein n=1 Tax=Tautonia sociabilis TaxID=2080755 RepID=A0A432MJR5_9BACT|nr:hypothetical protein [Tautonia sociabilis]RUL87489.1 hypothetical protein TsocGM_11650 [Tautonia sociabilis]
MTLCLVCRSFGPPCPSSLLAIDLAGLGTEVHVILAPDSASEGLVPEGIASGPHLPTVHRLPTPPPSGRFWSRAGRARRAAIAEAIRRLSPAVVHFAEGIDPRVAVPVGTVVLLDPRVSPPPTGADAAVLPDGRMIDRLGLPVPHPGVPPRPTGGPVDDGLDPAMSRSQWRALTYLASVDELSRTRRVRIDRPHPTFTPPRRLSRQPALLRGAVGLPA